MSKLSGFVATNARYIRDAFRHAPVEAVLGFVVAVTFSLAVGADEDEIWKAWARMSMTAGVVLPLLVTTSIAAHTGRIAVFVAATTDFTITPLEVVGFAFSPTFAAVLGWVGSRYVYQLGLDIKQAEAMGNYKLIRRLGAGGMGEVWEGEHARLARRAAIKFVSTVELGPQADAFRRRFVREASSTASLRSPHTVEVFDFGVASDGRLYYAMELLDGLDLEDLVARHGPVSPERTVHILCQLLESLEEAHARGLVHRDIKPANVFLARYGMEVDFVKVLDFGLAVDLASGDERLTAVNQIVGTPAFMPPENAMGQSLDARGDLYAVGCVAFWCLTGRTVFEADSPMAHVIAHTREEPPPPSRYAPAPLPPGLDDVMFQALAKDPDDRIQHAREFIERLVAIPLASAWTPARAEEWWRTHVDGHPTVDVLSPEAAPTEVLDSGAAEWPTGWSRAAVAHPHHARATPTCLSPPSRLDGGTAAGPTPRHAPRRPPWNPTLPSSSRSSRGLPS